MGKQGMTAIIEKPSAAFGEVIENLAVAPGHFHLTIRLPLSFGTPNPGQFVMIRDPGRDEPLLPRPISVYGFQREEGHAILNLLCRVTGRGTSLFSRLNRGEALTVLGPLGRGFSIDPDVRQLLLVGGGVGAAPLAFLLQDRSVLRPDSGKRQVTAYLGAGTAELLTGLNLFEGFCNLQTCTDDGSRGYHGTVTERLAVDLGGYDAKSSLILACGPEAMIRSLDLLLRGARIRCQVSLEERMACGVGACLGCVVAIKAGEGQTVYRRVCHDGPVFDIGEILWNPPAAERCKSERCGDATNGCA
jgi:dihydroorotate dehydrogenase electron transfer subunit